jgi:hypothetical protein
MESTRYLLVKGFSGIGNRLQALAEAIIYARLSRRRLLIDWNDSLYSSDGKDIFHRLCELPVAGRITDVPPDASVAPAIWSGRLDRPFDAMIERHRLSFGTQARSLLSIDPDMDYAETIAVMYDWTFRLPLLLDRPAPCPDEWRGLNATELLRKLLRECVRPNARIARRIEEFVRAHFGTPTIGVHVRQTDNMSAAWIDRKGVSVSAIDTVLGEKLHSEPGATIFLATDNRAVEKSFLRRYDRVVIHPKWYPRAAGEAIHGHYACPDKLRAAEDAFIDLYLLSRCDFLIYSSRTTFARCAAYISDQPSGSPGRAGGTTCRDVWRAARFEECDVRSSRREESPRVCPGDERAPPRELDPLSAW